MRTFKPKGARYEDVGTSATSALLNECPEVVGIMSLVLGNGGSLDSAARAIAEAGLARSSPMFSRVVDDADTRLRPDLKRSLSDMLSSLPEGCSAYAMAVRMIISASEARTDAEMGRLMDEARSVALDGLREAGKAYSSSLNAPCMVIFCVGIMIPMVLMSVMPMLGISGLFGGTPMDGRMLAAVTLVAIPATVACVMLSIRARNPFISVSRSALDPRLLVPLALAVPFYILLSPLTEGYRAICMSLAAASLAALAVMSAGTQSGRSARRKAELLTESVFDMGNYLLSGMPFDAAFRTAVSPRRGCSDVAERLDREMDLCRGDCLAAIRNSVGPVSPRLALMFCEIYSASLKDIRESGRLALSLGRQVMNQEAVRRGIRSDLKSMTDTMSGTAAVFAPLVLGLSITILGPLSRISSDVDVMGTGTVLAVYLAELSLLIACTVSFLRGETGARGIAVRFVTLLPVAMTVFLVTTMLSI